VKRRSAPQPESETLAPLWILSFGDMITNFLAFFILLQTFSHVRKAEILETGDAVASTVSANFGGPSWLMGRRAGMGWENMRPKYPVEADADAIKSERIIDAEDEMIRKAFDDIRREADTQATDGPAGRMRLFVTPIQFAAGQSSLDSPAVDFIAGMVSELEQVARGSRRCIYVVGAAPEATSSKDQLLLSARRAQAVREALAQRLSPELLGDGSRLLAWGIGAGRQGLGGVEVQAPSIVIAVQESSTEE
jgi:outer membrane protein OmpA-like peptidoglycan-associated protein